MSNNFESYYYKDTYYVSYTIHSDVHRYIAVSIESFDESDKLIAKNTPMLVQFTHEQPMNYKQMEIFLDKVAQLETKGNFNYKFLYGNGVDKNRINTI